MGQKIYWANFILGMMPNPENNDDVILDHEDDAVCRAAANTEEQMMHALYGE